MGCMNCNGPVLHPTPYTLHPGIIISDHPCFAGLCFCELRQNLKSCNEQNIWVWKVFALHKMWTFETGALVVGDVECVHYLFDLQSTWSRRQPRDCVWGGETPSNLSTWWVSFQFNTNKFNYSLREVLESNDAYISFLYTSINIE